MQCNYHYLFFAVERCIECLDMILCYCWLGFNDAKLSHRRDRRGVHSKSKMLPIQKPARPSEFGLFNGPGPGKAVNPGLSNG